MRRSAFAFLVFFLLMGCATALDPVNVAIKSSHGYVVANGTDSAVITVAVTDGAAWAIKGADVILSITPPWELKKNHGKTDGGGSFVTEILPTTGSGDAVVTASVTVKGVTTVPVVGTYTQAIIADTPSEQVKSYPISATIGATAEISVVVRDKNGNPVDSRKKKNQVIFTTTAGGNNGFTDKKDVKKKKVKGISVPLDATGTAATDFTLDTKPGENFVVIDPPRPLPVTLISIQGVADGKPALITQTVTPGGSPPTLTSDNVSKFTLEYQLFDAYGNPTTHQDLSISSNLGEMKTISSNQDGVVGVTYGPKLVAGQYTITAVAVANPAVAATQVLRFTSDDPVDMLLTASPQSMASLDLNKDVVSRVMAKVIDTVGNPVQGQTVAFSLQSVDVGTFVQTQVPAIQSGKKKTSTLLEEITSVTDENGIAALDFYPGAFAKGAAAEGTAKIRARWSGVTRDLELSYKNYPYLSVSTSVDPLTVQTEGEVNVSILLRGDGYALLPKPVDVLMLNDRSGSMLGDYPDRMVVEMNAAQLFAAKFDYKDDRLGMLSFGTNGKANAKGNADCGKDGDSSDDAGYAKDNYKKDGKNYGDWAVLDLGLSSKLKEINSAISGLVPSGYTPMRFALYKGITEMKNSGRSEAVRALVVMSDGDYNRFGDPLARGPPGSSDPNAYDDLAPDYVPFGDLSSQSMADYAEENSIRIYTIGYAADISPGGKATLEQLATQTGGRYFYAASDKDLEDVYNQIAGDLKEAAGVNTLVQLDFKNVEVNGDPVPGEEVFDYVYKPGKSTRVTRPDGSGYDVNNTDDWKNGQLLNYDLGTIKLKDVWMVNFTLRVEMGGNIKLLGESSRVLFDEGKGSLTIPDTYLTATEEGTEKGLEGLALKIKILSVTIPENKKDSAEIVWAITYNGGDEEIEETIERASLNSDHFGFYGATSTKNRYTTEPWTETYTMDVSGVPPGIYKVKMTGRVHDADDSSDVAQFTIPGSDQIAVILIR
jgi:hypothetical protein